jgi:HSP20 family protein
MPNGSLAVSSQMVLVDYSLKDINKGIKMTKSSHVVRTGKQRDLPTVMRNEFNSIFNSDRIFDEIFGPEFAQKFGIRFAERESYPKVDVVDTGDSLILEAEIPGLTKKDVSVELEDNILSISGVKRQEVKEGHTIVRKEIKRSSFTRTFDLEDGFEQSEIEADFKDGILLVKIPKKKEVIEKSKKRKIL